VFGFRPHHATLCLCAATTCGSRIAHHTHHGHDAFITRQKTSGRSKRQEQRTVIASSYTPSKQQPAYHGGHKCGVASDGAEPNSTDRTFAKHVCRVRTRRPCSACSASVFWFWRCHRPSSAVGPAASSIRLHIPYVHEPPIRTLGCVGFLPTNAHQVVLSRLDAGRCLFADMPAFHVQGFIRGLTLDRILWLFSPCWETQVIGTLCACAVAPGCRRLPPVCGGVCARLQFKERILLF
jgi:hypothetical protein